MNYFCIYDHSAAVGVTVVCVVFNIIALIMIGFIFKWSLAKYKEISSPNEALPWDKTYCYLSLHQVRAVQVYLGFLGLVLVQSTF